MLDIKKDREYILKRYLQDNIAIKDIAKELNYKYVQPIYNLLNKEQVFEKHKTGENKSRRYTVNEDFFKTIDTEAKAYILGFISADGHLDEKHNRIKIELNSKDRCILESIRLAMDSTHPIKDVVRKGGYNHSILSINSKILVNDLKQFDLSSNKSTTMGNIYKHIPEELKNHFLRGYFDGDGNITYGKKYSSGTKYLVQVIGTEEFLSTSFNSYFESNCSLYKYKSCNMYCWKIANKSQVDMFITKLYNNATIYLERKKVLI